MSHWRSAPAIPFERVVIISMPFLELMATAAVSTAARGKGVAEEVWVARGVEEVDAGGVAPVLRLETRHRELEGVVELLFAGGVIADGGTALDAPGGVNCARFREKTPGQGGLAAARLAFEREVLMPLMEFVTGLLSTLFLFHSRRTAVPERAEEWIEGKAMGFYIGEPA